ncbi:hypothetical protein [Parabacteroides sp. PF5-9]|uniref:hypothetical protein n=1 Tax=Parabacteroides sp. PF5-9 TaxID=1742404 RepID=UPI002476F652|nr:hypothetical protein [Parabacteroides sp. PF5-9]MDH6357603.1 hypothetical protein [Parabacteroides sp. PF5-9]
MKRLVMAVAALAFSATLSMTHAQSVSKKPFMVDFNKLSTYLDLAPYQMTEVVNINDYFIEMQKESLSRNPVRQERKMHQAVYGNLKLMKEVLTTEQYRKYVTLLNVTNNNNRVLGHTVVSDVYLAHTK